MAIKKFWTVKSKPNSTYDRKEKRYFSWGYDIWLNGERHQQRGHPTKQAVERVVAKLKEDALLEKHGFAPRKVPKGSITLDAVLQKYLNTIPLGKNRKRALVILKRWQSLLPPGITVTELRTAHIQEYVSARLADRNQRNGESILPQTINRELAPIMSALNSTGLHFPDLDKFQAPKTPRQKEPKGRKERVISANEQKLILEFLFADRRKEEDRRAYESRRRTGQFLLFCLLTLSRPGEAAKLKKSDVHFDRGIVSITSWKTRHTSARTIRDVKITPTLREILTDRLETSESDYVFTSGGAVTPRMYDAMKAACEKYGIRYGRDDKSAISFHTARHTGITRLLQRGFDLKTIGQIAGHSDMRMTLYYSHTNTTLTDAASDALEDEIDVDMTSKTL